MPASEQTWRNTKWMHMVFGLTSLALLLASLWMFSDDHNREWKAYQSDYFNRLEVWNQRARQAEQQTPQFTAGQAARDEEVKRQREQAPGKALADLFALEQRYFHNRAWLEPTDAESVQSAGGVKKNAAASTSARRFDVEYATLLNEAEELLDLETAAAATAVELSLARGDAQGETDADRRNGQLQRVKELDAAAQLQTKRLDPLRKRIGTAAADFTEAIRQEKNADKTDRFVESIPAQTVEELHKALSDAADVAVARQILLDELTVGRRGHGQGQITRARFEEETKQTAMKFERANLDVARSEFDLRLGEVGGDPSHAAELASLQAAVKSVAAKVAALERDYTALNRHRKQLDAVLAAMTAGESAAKKASEKHKAEIDRLEKQIASATSVAARAENTVLGLPILDAFYNSPQIGLKDKQRWLPDLTLDRNFNTVPRYDRCEACHLGIVKASPGDPLQPGYEPESSVALVLPTPTRKAEGVEVFLQRREKDEELRSRFKDKAALANYIGLIGGSAEDDEGKPTKALASEFTPDQLTLFVKDVYGFHLAAKGIWTDDEPTVEFVARESLAADAGLKRGDVIFEIGGDPITTREAALRKLVDHQKWGQPLRLKVRRGVKQPFSTHPRLDLFASDLSPHPVSKFGCTICHDGQGNGTAFKWASHTPNTLGQAEDWSRKLGWFDNQHWIFPMRPKRFAESNCLKCHHDLGELEPSERFPDPPAPSLMEGYHTVRTSGCFGCHEIKGFDGPNKRIGPDLRLEPNYAAAADQIRQVQFGGQPPPAANRADSEFYAKLLAVRKQPEEATLRRELQHLLRQRTLKAELVGAVDALKDEDVPGKMRKVGPSLRYVADKLDPWFLYNQVKDPIGFRPDSRMPSFFGLHKHIQASVEAKAADEAKGKSSTQDLEQVEVLAITGYLLGKSQSLTLQPPPGRDKLAEPLKRMEKAPGAKEAQEVNEPPLSRGKFLFQTRGCLACHQHSSFPAGKEDQGPDLSHVGDKLAGKDGANSERGRKWLYNWLLDPTNYHARTKMPNTFLGKGSEKWKGKDGKETTREIDPALEITEFLMASRAVGAAKWQGVELPDAGALQPALRELALEHLQGGSGFTRSQALSYLDQGIPAALAGELKGDEVELLQNAQGKFDARQQLVYLGRRSISKYGCYACHDVPGFESAKPIGTALADWGRKETSKIAFEQIGNYLQQTDLKGLVHGHGHEVDVAKLSLDESTKFFFNSLMHHQREGFLWQKLREPRSYDYEKTQNKKYNERLKMPQFRFAATESENTRIREQVMTFVLGLVSEAPAEKYLYRPDPRRKAIAQGRRVLTKYNCGGCHTLEMEQWRLSFTPDQIPAKSYPTEYAFLLPQVSADVLERSKLKDERGFRRAVVTGAQALDPATGLPWRKLIDKDRDEDPDRFTKPIELWKFAVIDGSLRLVADGQIDLPEEQVQVVRESVGGSLARMLPPLLVAEDRRLQALGQRNAALEIAKTKDALALGPPPLINEGRKAQAAWLHDFLLDPHPIRPSTVLRMPKFNLSSDEATALVDYFAALDSAEFPYAFDQRTQPEYLARQDQRFQGRLDDALTLVRTKCLQCHRMGDFVPERYDQAPNLANVYPRIRPEYLRDWLANPARLLPYTAMPVNIPADKGVDKSEFTGFTMDVKVGPLFDRQPGDPHAATSADQLGAVVDLLLNYDRYSQRNEKIEELKKEAPKPAGKAEPAGKSDTGKTEPGKN